ncbi:OmpH family outer membrane protein [Sansalvadorimonas sp. 2012CJ34-2]|uniref:OmpH family outer membrane protein n=1 Tax=Parendozoicomonas callyspongiae TaxID=2942213 RepID=A0ABT0PKT1_9GAMM|nr:OmpH family outer membrane protein [Sansalvadorimonas sp. 2012CJ34-2]MCL6271997.1 OmpH family outer membrane protein [Sansalvadorimonas sp. 2012CJ34-2]
MRSLKCMAMALVMAAPFALQAPLAEAGGVAVINSQVILQESAAAKAYAEKTKKKYKSQVDALEKLDKEYQALDEKLKKSGALMSPAERAKIEAEKQNKENSFNAQRLALGEEKAKDDKAEFERIAPLANQALAKVAEDGDFDVVVEAATVRYAKSGTDITAKVIEQLNKLTSKK